MARASALHAEGHRFDSDILHFFNLRSAVIMINKMYGEAVMWFKSITFTTQLSNWLIAELTN